MAQLLHSSIFIQYKQPVRLYVSSSEVVVGAQARLAG